MNFLEAKNLSQALDYRKEHPTYKLLAGGTDLCVLMNSGIIKPEGLISIWGLDELKQITEEGDVISIGALVTHSAVAQSGMIQKHIPVLGKACLTVGARQIQNRGTIGGNIMNASPAGDTLPVLLAYDATIEVSNTQGSRQIPFTEFYTGYRQTALKEDEMVTRILIKKPNQGEKADFIKIGTRKAQAISKVMACFRMQTQDDVITSFQAAYGSVAAIPVRVTALEEFLVGEKLEEKTIEEAIQITKDNLNPIDDIRSTADYRKHVCGVMVKRFLVTLLQS
ncbi:MAG: xanthine dehydrogenase family protein subunit M [bacterium]|nr:xanthine dehydrogenase family protein subunit M [bacterium]MBU1918449.1 xanthine dehydrogenase family protein subunit M [bacterium]